MNEQAKQDHDEAALILKTINGFIDGAKYIDTKNMAALMGALIESAVATLADNTDADTALWMLSQIILRLSPQCQRGTVQIMPMTPSTKQ